MPLKVVRLGRSDAINPAVKDLTLEELVDKELQTKQVEVVTDPNLRSELNKMTQERDRLRSRLNDETLDPKEKDGVQQKLLEINKQRSELTKNLMIKENDHPSHTETRKLIEEIFKQEYCPKPTFCVPPCRDPHTIWLQIYQWLLIK